MLCQKVSCNAARRVRGSPDFQQALLCSAQRVCERQAEELNHQHYQAHPPANVQLALHKPLNLQSDSIKSPDEDKVALSRINPLHCAKKEACLSKCSSTA